MTVWIKTVALVATLATSACAAGLFVQLMPFDKVQLHKRFRDAVYGAIQP
jgi:hypothetical protein